MIASELEVCTYTLLHAYIGAFNLSHQGVAAPQIPRRIVILLPSEF